MQMEKDSPDFHLKQCRESPGFDEIHSFTFGGISSRFQMLRKYINSIKLVNLDKVPVKCWDCISLRLKYRDVDLVISDQIIMNMLLSLLIYKLNTINGIRNSAVPVKKALFDRDSANVSSGIV